MDCYYAAVAEKSGIRHVFRSEEPIADAGDLLCGKCKSLTLVKYKAITPSTLIVCGTGAESTLQALYWGDIPEITRVTREVWAKGAASDVQDG